MKYFITIFFLIFSVCFAQAKTYDFSDEAAEIYLQEQKKINIPQGEIIYSRLNSDISSEQNSKNEIITTQLIKDWKLNNRIIAPEGSLIIGKIFDIKNASYASKNANVDIVFNQIIRPDNSTIYIQSKPICIKVDGSQLETAGKNILKGVTSRISRHPQQIANRIVGGVMKGGYIFLTTKGQEINIPFGTEFKIQILNSITVTEYEN